MLTMDNEGIILPHLCGAEVSWTTYTRFKNLFRRSILDKNALPPQNHKLKISLVSGEKLTYILYMFFFIYRKVERKARHDEIRRKYGTYDPGCDHSLLSY